MSKLLLSCLAVTFILSSAELEQKSYELKDPNVHNIPGDFLVEIFPDTETVEISMVGDEQVWMGLGLGSQEMENTIAYIYHFDDELNEMVLSKYLLQNHEPKKYLGRIKNWSISTTNGIAVVSFRRAFKVHGTEFDFFPEMTDLSFIYAVGESKHLNYHNSYRAHGNIIIEHKKPPQIVPRSNRFVRDREFGFGSDRISPFEDKFNADPFESNNDRGFNNREMDNRFDHIETPSVFQDRFSSNVNTPAVKYDTNRDRINSRYGANDEDNNFYDTGSNQLHNKRNAATNDFNRFQNNNGDTYYARQEPENDRRMNRNDAGREEFFGEFRNRMGGNTDHYSENSDFFNSRP